MMGLGATITPNNSGTIMVIISGDATNSTNGNGGSIRIKYNSGVPPTNGSGTTGLTVGGIVNFNNPTNSSSTIFPFTLNAIIPALMVGTQYWVDLSLVAVGGGVATIDNVSISIVEL
jgi:hypothetical protein